MDHNYTDPSQWDDYNTDTSLGTPPTSPTSTTGSLLQKLLGGSQPGQNLGDLSKVLGGFSSGEKANRVVQGNFTQAYDRNMLQAQQDRNANESDALKKLYSTNYLKNGGSHFQLPTSLSLGGTSHTVPNLGLGPLPASEAQQQGAKTLESQLLTRLAPGGSYTPRPLSEYANPGLSEQIGNFGALGAGGLGSLANIFGNGSNKGQSGPTPLDPNRNSADGGGGNGPHATFSLPWEGFGGPSSQGPAGTPFGSTDGSDAAYNFSQNYTQGIDPSTLTLPGQQSDPMAEYYAWLSQNGINPLQDNGGGGDAFSSAGDSFGNP